MHVTRNVKPQDVADLGADPPRACLAVVRDGRTVLVPVRAQADGEGYRILVPRDDVAGLDGTPALLVLDDGVAWFELRAVTARGTLTAVPAGTDDTDDVPFTLTPRRVVAWDYGAIRPGSDPHGQAPG
jgi:hypothetical protein